MCILIHQTRGVTLSDDVIRDCYIRNTHGFGYILKNGKTEKGIYTIDEILQIYKNKLAKKECFIHMRMRTHGDISRENCHPYPINNGGQLMHNGVMPEALNLKISKRSDTYHFAQKFLRNIDILHDENYRELLGAAIGSSNKLAIFIDDKFYIINKQHGYMHFGAWFSNHYAWSAWQDKSDFTYKTRYNYARYQPTLIKNQQNEESTTEQRELDEWDRPDVDVYNYRRWGVLS